MTEYRLPLDICNRALQHVGAAGIGTLNEDTKNAGQTAFAYDKVRRAELKRNLWTFATRRAVLRPIGATTMLLAPPAWVATTYYQVGHIVTDTAGIMWMSRLAFNINHNPATFGGDPTWEPYTGPLTCDVYDSTQTYSPGEIVYVQGATAGLASIYIAATMNTDNPTAFPTYDATVTYTRGQVVKYSGVFYISLINLNIANTPTSPLSLWASGTTYGSGDQVAYHGDGRIYTSTGTGNLGNEPSLTSAFWTAASSPPYVQPWLTYAGGNGALSWIYYGDGLSIELTSPNIMYPISTGPSNVLRTRYYYKTPAGFLKLAPQDPKQGSVSIFGASTGLTYTDWVIENGYIVTSDIGPIMCRFVADITDVTRMDDMFCEGLAAAIGEAICESLTQSTEKKEYCTQTYKRMITEARISSAVEGGAIEPPEDDYISCRGS